MGSRRRQDMKILNMGTITVEHLWYTSRKYFEKSTRYNPLTYYTVRLQCSFNADSVVSLFSPLCGDSVWDTETRHARIDPHAEGAGPPAPIYDVRYAVSLEFTRHRDRHSPEDGNPFTTACELLITHYLLLTRYYSLFVTLLLHY